MDEAAAINVSQEEISRLSPQDHQGLQQFLQAENAKAQIQKTTHELTEVCFKKCIIGSISGRLASKEESCIQNCVERFMDSNLAVLSHLEKLKASQ
ncbi:hypothetical protein DV736_g135, partial [Chaetothyriales sp. CBS 134916]